MPKKLQNEGFIESTKAKMKGIARSYVWWPGLDKCKSVKSTPTVAPLQLWVWSSRPWQKVHVDFAEPFKESMFFVLVDGHSRGQK